jgi:heme-degrading monooxygenase HmoA
LHAIDLKRLVLTASCIAVLACGGDDKAHVSAVCTGDQLESDLESAPFEGPGVSASGALQLAANTEYVVSSTYGVPKPGPDGAPITERYGQLFGAVQQQLSGQPGLLALKLATSERCGSGRTLAVWQSEEAMYDFVASDAHVAAMLAAQEGAAARLRGHALARKRCGRDGLLARHRRARQGCALNADLGSAAFVSIAGCTKRRV